jgi:CheY-like chemotaxis protein
MRLLVVDDESTVLQVLKAMLEPLGAEVVAMSNSRQAAEKFESERYDGLVFDARMPEPDGFELTRLARASSLNSKVPIVILTGYDDADTMRRGFKAGATCFLGKPATRERIQSLMGALRGQMLKEMRRHARLPYRTQVLGRLTGPEARSFVAKTIDIGEGGMLFQPSGGAAEGQELALQFSVPSVDRLLKMRGRVVRRDTLDRCAVEFFDSPIADWDVIRNFINAKLQGLDSGELGRTPALQQGLARP